MHQGQRDHPLRGLRVVAVIDDGPPLTELTGILEWVGLDGEVAVRCDDGVTRYGWPCLDLRQARGTHWEPDPQADWPAGPTWPEDEPVRPTRTVWLPGDEPSAGSSTQGMP
jgi:hypothetical protein